MKKHTNELKPGDIVLPHWAKSQQDNKVQWSVKEVRPTPPLEQTMVQYVPNNNNLLHTMYFSNECQFFVVSES